jgi:hypothetical protein
MSAMQLHSFAGCSNHLQRFILVPMRGLDEPSRGPGRPFGSRDRSPRTRRTRLEVHGPDPVEQAAANLDAAIAQLTTKASVEERYEFTRRVLEHVYDAFDVLVQLCKDKEQPGTVRVAAIKEIFRRGLGKSPQHVDVTMFTHTEVVYQNANDIIEELKRRGVPNVLLDLKKLTPPTDEDIVDDA